MVVRFDASKPFKKCDYDTDLHTVKCCLCGEQSDTRIFYDALQNGNCVCKNCEGYLKGLFKDYLLAISESNKTKLNEKLQEFCEETLEQFEYRQYNGYTCCREVEIVDNFEDTYSLEEIQQFNIVGSLRYLACYNQMITYMESHYSEKPYVIRFFKTDDFYDEYGENKKDDSAICGIAKVYNNGTTVIFGDSDLLLEKSKYDLV